VAPEVPCMTGHLPTRAASFPSMSLSLVASRGDRRRRRCDNISRIVLKIKPHLPSPAARPAAADRDD
ncbi:MAG: hypothetical protein AB7F67_20390, partial [Rhodospirillaceae bacterium]